MNTGQSAAPSDSVGLEDIARSVSDLTSLEAQCHRFFTRRRPDSLALMEDAFNIYLDALRITSGERWQSYSEQAVILWSFMAFHTARAAALLALTGYFPQVLILVRSLADQANNCVLFPYRPEYAERVLKGGRVLDTKEILPMLDEKPWPGYETLHSFVHARAEAVASYLKITTPDQMSLGLGPDDAPEKFDDAVANISLFLLLAAQMLGSVREPLRQDEAWWKKFGPLMDRCLALVQQRYGAPSKQDEKSSRE